MEGEEDDVFVKASKTRGALNGDIVTLPNGKTMDLSKLPEANREKVLAKLGLK